MSSSGSFTYSEDEENKSFISKVWDYMHNSSCFMIPRTNGIRETLLILVTTPEDIVRKEKAELDAEGYGIKDISKSQVLKSLDINEGKVITSKNRKTAAKVFEYFIVVVILLS